MEQEGKLWTPEMASETNDGEYPYVGTVSAHNNMIVKYVDYYDLDGDFICINPVPPAIGMCSVHHGKIAVQRNVPDDPAQERRQ